MNIALQMMYARRRRLQTEAVKPVVASSSAAVKALFSFDPKAGDPTPSGHFSDTALNEDRWDDLRRSDEWGVIDTQGKYLYGTAQNRGGHDDLVKPLNFRNSKDAIRNGFVRFWHGTTTSNLELAGYRKDSVNNAIKHIKSTVPRGGVEVYLDIHRPESSRPASYRHENSIEAVRMLQGLLKVDEAFKGWSKGEWGVVDPKGNTHYGNNDTMATHDDLVGTLGIKSVAHAIRHGFVRWTTNHSDGETNLQFIDKPNSRKAAIRHLQSIPRDYNVRMDVMDHDGSYKPYFWPNPGYAIRHLKGENLGEVRSEITPESLASHYGYGEEFSTDSHKFGNVTRYLHPSGHNLIVVHRYQKARDLIGDSKHPGEWSVRWEHVSSDGVVSQGHTVRQLLQLLSRTHTR